MATWDRDVRDWMAVQATAPMRVAGMRSRRHRIVAADVIRRTAKNVIARDFGAVRQVNETKIRAMFSVPW